MRSLATALALLAVLSAAPQPTRAPRQEIEHAAAFARLYGVVRYFYPSDAAAAVDWNRVAVHGVKLARTARTPDDLSRVLADLFAPLGPGIDVSATLPPAPASGAPDARLIAWRYLGPGFSAGPGPYAAKRTNRARVSLLAGGGFASLMQTVPADALRGKTIRLRGQARVTAREEPGGGALWVRVDRANKQVGFFDNMGNRPIVDPDWREYTVEGPVADDAAQVAFGAMAMGATTVDFDALALDVRGADGQWTPVPFKDQGFEAAPGSADWTLVGQAAGVEVTRPDASAPQGRQFVRFTPRAGTPSDAELFDAAPRSGGHAEVDLGGGLRARVALVLTDEQARPDAGRTSKLDALRAALATAEPGGNAPGLDQRLADIVVAWNVFRHFYPYWTEAGVDWDSRLRPRLESAYEATTRPGHVDALKRLVADARDGHGSVTDQGTSGSRATLPVQFGFVEGQVVVVATSRPDDAPVGASVSRIDGTAATVRLDALMELGSGTAQWRRSRALRELATCARDAKVALVVDSGSGLRETSLPCESAPPPVEPRPEPIAELSAGTWYVDLTRARTEQLKPMLPKLATAKAVVFDLRGYPTDAGAQVLPHLIESAERDRWMHVARIVGPFGQYLDWASFGWDLQPAAPRIGGRIAFLTDGRAISYAESVMGYVGDRKLATTVGGPTAGTNGNVATFRVPTGLMIAFTGMRVTRHDGRTAFHLEGVQPDIAVEPTIAGLRAGRDVVLERALAAIRGQ